MNNIPLQAPLDSSLGVNVLKLFLIQLMIHETLTATLLISSPHFLILSCNFSSNGHFQIIVEDITNKEIILVVLYVPTKLLRIFLAMKDISYHCIMYNLIRAQIPLLCQIATKGSQGNWINQNSQKIFIHIVCIEIGMEKRPWSFPESYALP